MTGGCYIICTDTGRLAAQCVVVVLYVASLALLLRWRASRDAPQMERTAAGDDQGGEQLHGEVE